MKVTDGPFAGLEHPDGADPDISLITYYLADELTEEQLLAVWALARSNAEFRRKLEEMEWTTKLAAETLLGHPEPTLADLPPTPKESVDRVTARVLEQIR